MIVFISLVLLILGNLLTSAIPLDLEEPLLQYNKAKKVRTKSYSIGIHYQCIDKFNLNILQPLMICK